jgi:hypothetical protein
LLLLLGAARLRRLPCCCVGGCPAAARPQQCGQAVPLTSPAPPHPAPLLQVAPEAVGASQGLLGWIAYLGAANAGVPLSLVVQRYGWGGYFSTLAAACAVALLLLAPLAGARSHVQKRAAALA